MKWVEQFPLSIWVDLFIENCLYGIVPAFINVKNDIRMNDTISSIYICQCILWQRSCEPHSFARRIEDKTLI